MKRSISILVYITCTIALSAQDIEVMKFEPMVEDQTAALSPRKDINGNECALVLVHTLKKSMEFEGWIVGDVEYRDDAYWVFIANGSKHLKIKHPDYHTKTVLFSEYGISSLKGGQKYSLYLVDGTKDVINEIYCLGWNLKDIKVSEKVRTFLNMSARRGDTKAIRALAQLSIGGEVLKGNQYIQNKGLHWINKLLEKGDSACLDSMPGELMYVYACQLLEKGLSHDRSANRVDTQREKVVYSEASYFDLKACLKGYREAGNDFFDNYIHSNGLSAYKKEVIRICTDSASVGNSNAMTCLGHIYENGICEDINLQQAALWYYKAYSSNPSNQFKSNLCRLYGNCHYPIDKDALRFIMQRAEEGLQEALYQLGCMYEEGRNVEKSKEKAIELLKKVTFDPNDRHQKATYRLAKIYYDDNKYVEAEQLLRYLYDDELDALYLRALILFQDKRNFKIDAYNILNDLSKKGYKKATDFIKNNY